MAQKKSPKTRKRKFGSSLSPEKPIVSVKILFVCSDCGNRYGKYVVGASSWITARCDVCKEEKLVAPAGNFKIDVLMKHSERGLVNPLINPELTK